MRYRESAVVNACLRLLFLRGVAAWRVNSGSVKVGKRLVRLAPAGTPDILGVLPAHGGHPPGRLLGVECKRKGGKLRDSQRAWMESMEPRGVLYLVVTDAAQLDAALTAEGV
jgi:hypothetical protein